jgi:hypothetical protein
MKDSDYFDQHDAVPKAFMHFVAGPKGLTRPLLAMLLSVLLIFFEAGVRLVMAAILDVLTSMITSQFAVYFPVLATYKEGWNSVRWLSEAVHLISFLSWFLFRVGNYFWIVLFHYDMEAMFSVTYLGRISWFLISGFIGVCEHNTFTLYTPEGLKRFDNTVDRRLTACRDPDKRLPSHLRPWTIQLGTIAWPINKRPQLFAGTTDWIRGASGGPKTSTTMNLIGDNIVVTWTEMNEHKHIPVLNRGAFLAHSKRIEACDVYMMNLLSPRNTNRLNTWEVAVAYIRRDAASIKHINVDQSLTLRLRNVVSDTQMISIGWLIHDRQKTEVFTNALKDFRLSPQA